MEKELNGIDSGMRPWQRFALAILGGFFIYLCFEPAKLGFLAWIALVPLYLCGHRRTDRGLFWYGFIFGWVYFTLSMSFLRDIFFFCPLLTGLIWAPVPGIWLVCVKRFADKLKKLDEKSLSRYPRQHLLTFKNALLLTLMAASLWSCLEWIRHWLFTGLPWNTLAISQAYTAPTRIISSLGGESLLSFCLSLVNCGFAILCDQALLKRHLQKKDESHFPCSQKKLGLIIIPGILLTIACSFIASALHPTIPSTKTARVLMIQGDFPPYKTGLTRELYEKHLMFYFNESMKAKGKKIDLIIWPETATPMSWQRDSNLQELIKKACVATNTPMLIGTPYRDDIYDPRKKEPRTAHYNAALLFDKTGALQEKYFKIHTVPYGEYMPFQYLMPESWWLKADEMRQMGQSLDSGKLPTLLQVPEKGLRLGVNICFEDVFSDVSRTFSEQGANILLTITNDSWFGHSSGGASHSTHAIFRAIETGLPMLRCGNTCETMYVNNRGEIENLLLASDGSRFSEGSMEVEIPVMTEALPTPYSQYPWILPFILSSLSIAFLSWTMWKSTQVQVYLAAKKNRT